MLRIAYVLAFGFLCTLSSVASAQMPSAPEPEHQLLKKFEGKWDVDNRTVAAPGQPEAQCKGESTAKMLGDFWIVVEAHNTMEGTKIEAFQTIGYDAKKKKYVGTWVDSMFNHLWHYEGSFDKASNTLVLEATGPDMMNPEKQASYRDSYEFKSPDHIVATSSMKDEKGEWVLFMKGNLKKKP